MQLHSDHASRGLYNDIPRISPGFYSNQYHSTTLLDSSGLPTADQFDYILNEYILSLSTKKRDKALIPQKRYDNIIAVLKDKKCTTIESAQFRFWAKRSFKLSNNADVVLHEGKPVAVRENLYDVLRTCHLEAQHGGRDKTSAAVRKQFSWVPKELIARFVKNCPSCIARRTSPTENRSVYPGPSISSSESDQERSPTYQQHSPTYQQLSTNTYQQHAPAYHAPNTVIVPATVQVQETYYQPPYAQLPPPSGPLLSYQPPHNPPRDVLSQRRSGDRITHTMSEGPNIPPTEISTDPRTHQASRDHRRNYY
ncbi:hypothetical protein EDC01DRAFT_617854 [Geopyxis carbonaria]|nr:hypothetical protein EDC01DRAFT_617854 [Geopyxis carbonaria]